MNCSHHKRGLSFAVFSFATIGAVLIAVGSNTVLGSYFSVNDPANTFSSIVEIEKLIAEGNTSSKLWLQYARALQSANEYSRAAEAFRLVLKNEPYHNEALFQRAICLAQAERPVQLKEYMSELVLTHAKLAEEVFEREELNKFCELPEFKELVQEAKSQALD